MLTCKSSWLILFFFVFPINGDGFWALFEGKGQILFAATRPKDNALKYCGGSIS